jgi:hypothetical protein
MKCRLTALNLIFIQIRKASFLRRIIESRPLLRELKLTIRQERNSDGTAVCYLNSVANAMPDSIRRVQMFVDCRMGDRECKELSLCILHSFVNVKSLEVLITSDAGKADVKRFHRLREEKHLTSCRVGVVKKHAWHLPPVFW